jgi:hypothetical protein
MAHKKSSHVGAVVAGIAGITAAAVGAYYLYGHEDAAKNRAKIKGWMLKAKGEVLEELEGAQDVTESIYMKAVDMVAKKYSQLKNIDMAELEGFIAEMRNHWLGIKNVGKAKAKPAKKTATKKSK